MSVDKPKAESGGDSWVSPSFSAVGRSARTREKPVVLKPSAPHCTGWKVTSAPRQASVSVFSSLSSGTVPSTQECFGGPTRHCEHGPGGPGNLSLEATSLRSHGCSREAISPPLCPCAWLLRSNVGCPTYPYSLFSVRAAFLPLEMLGTCFLPACLGVSHQQCLFFNSFIVMSGRTGMRSKLCGTP